MTSAYNNLISNAAPQNPYGQSTAYQNLLSSAAPNLVQPQQITGLHNSSTLPSSIPGANPQGSNGSQITSSNGGPVGMAPSATAGSDNANGINPGGWDWSQALSGQAGYGAMQTSQNYIYNPQAANYTIGGMGAYQGGQQQIGESYENLQNNATAQTAALGSLANSQNAGYQSGVNNATQQFLQNAQGLGNYDNSLASGGSDQQTAAYNAITNMANGNGPSLAAKNLQAGLNSENQAIQAQSMSNQGLGGAGNATRNLLNAQAANANNFGQAAQQASVAEQVGALQQQSAAANNIRSANQAQASAASSAGLAQRSMNQSALNTQFGAQLAGNTLQNNTLQNAYNSGNSTIAAGIAGQSGALNNQFNANVAQQQANQSYDTALQNEGNTRAQINTNAVQSQAGQNAGVVGTVGNIIGGVAGAIASDQNIKTNVDQGSSTTSTLGKILGAIGAAGDSLDGDIDFTKPSAKNSPSQLPQSVPAPQASTAPPDENSKLEATIAADKDKPTPTPTPIASVSSGGSSAQSKSGGSGGILGTIGSIFSTIFSDERTKTDIAAGDDKSREFLDNIKASSFRYKNENLSGTTRGMNLGVMAQDMQKSTIGRELVEQGDDGILRYSMPKAVNLSLASLAHLNQRINKLEKGKRK